MISVTFRISKISQSWIPLVITGIFLKIAEHHFIVVLLSLFHLLNVQNVSFLCLLILTFSIH
jgi:hypothetical protein